MGHDPEYFTWQDILIQQEKEVFKIGTDSLLLGSWVPLVVAEANLILDAGSGCGILGLMMARPFSKAQIHAIDTNENAVRLTERNILLSNWKERMICRRENILEPAMDPSFRYDLIISNPPFYTTHNPPEEEYRARAKHSDGPVGSWMTGLLNRLSQGGEVCIIVPSTAAQVWVRDANQMGYFVRNRMDVFSFASDVRPVRSLIHITNSLCKPVFTRMTVYQENRTYTMEYLQMTGISMAQNNSPLI